MTAFEYFPLLALTFFAAWVLFVVLWEIYLCLKLCYLTWVEKIKADGVDEFADSIRDLNAGKITVHELSILWRDRRVNK